MHDPTDHIDRPCPACGKDALHWSGRQICCDACECDWSIEDILDEWSTKPGGKEYFASEPEGLLDEKTANLPRYKDILREVVELRHNGTGGRDFAVLTRHPIAWLEKHREELVALLKEKNG